VLAQWYVVTSATLGPVDRALAGEPHDPVAGARNLLLNCAGVKAGDRLLLIVEPPGNEHYEPSVALFIAQQAREIGALVTIRAVAVAGGPEDVPADIMTAVGAASHTIFLNRIGDQLRFAPLPGQGSKTMCYALDMDFLGSYFAVTPYGAWEDIQARLVARLNSARSYSIRCGRGTDLSMHIDGQQYDQKRVGQFAVKNFPIMIVPPIPAVGLNGKLVLSHTLTSTYLHDYEDSIVPLASPLSLFLENGEIVRIEGDAALVARAQAQFERVATRFGGARWAVNSWHAGINTFAYFPRPALSDIDRWSAVVFASPRYAHFHMCGSAPGDICGQIFDPTITFDDAAIWRDGRATFLTSEDHRRLLESWSGSPDIGLRRRDIGVHQLSRAAGL